MPTTLSTMRGSPFVDTLNPSRLRFAPTALTTMGMPLKGAVESLMSFFSNAARERRHVCPSDLGVEFIGHYGFFQERFAPLFWQESVDWIGEFASPGAGWRGNKKGCQL